MKLLGSAVFAERRVWRLRANSRHGRTGTADQTGECAILAWTAEARHVTPSEPGYDSWHRRACHYRCTPSYTWACRVGRLPLRLGSPEPGWPRQRAAVHCPMNRPLGKLRYPPTPLQCVLPAHGAVRQSVMHPCMRREAPDTRRSMPVSLPIKHASVKYGGCWRLAGTRTGATWPPQHGVP